jgi:hypothetical protein
MVFSAAARPPEPQSQSRWPDRTARQGELNLNSRHDVFAQHDRGDRDLLTRHDLHLCKQQDR